MNNNVNKFLLGTTILSMVILLIGGTFSYFSLSQMSKMNAIAVESGKVRLGLGVSPIYTGYKIIPLEDKYIDVAYKQKCIDDLGNGACLAYGLEVFNFELATEVEGIIDFHLDGIENLSYMVLDTDGNVYKDITHIDVNNPNGLSLGNAFKLAEARDGISTSKKLVLLIWLSETGEIQDETDAGKKFSADVTFRTSAGGRLTASVDGMRDNSNNVSTIGE